MKFRFLIMLFVSGGSLAYADCVMQSRTRINSEIVSVMCVAPRGIFNKGKGVIHFTSDFDTIEALPVSSYKMCKIAEEASVKREIVSLVIKCIGEEEVIIKVAPSSN